MFLCTVLTLWQVRFGVCLQQLATLLITRQVIGNFKEAVLPYIVEKVKLMWIGIRIAESMSADSLQHEMQQFAEQSSADSVKKTDQSVEEDDDGNVDSDTQLHVETRAIGSEKIEIVHSGLNLTQAEVEAAMNKVGTSVTHLCYSFYLSIFLSLILLADFGSKQITNTL